MNNTKTLMTKETKLFLESQLKTMEEKLSEAGVEMGEAAGTDCDWHDNSAWDHAREEFNKKGIIKDDIVKALDNVEIIKPRQKVDTVGIGNTVIIKTDGIDGEKEFTILGSEDTLIKKEWISHMAPVSQAILGLKVGEVGTFMEGKKVTVTEILPGKFK